MSTEHTCTAFAGMRRVASGAVIDVAIAAKPAIGADAFHPGNIDFEFYPDINARKQGC